MDSPVLNSSVKQGAPDSAPGNN